MNEKITWPLSQPGQVSIDQWYLCALNVDPALSARWETSQRVRHAVRDLCYSPNSPPRLSPGSCCSCGREQRTLRCSSLPGNDRISLRLGLRSRGTEGASYGCLANEKSASRYAGGFRDLAYPRFRESLASKQCEGFCCNALAKFRAFPQVQTQGPGAAGSCSLRGLDTLTSAT